VIVVDTSVWLAFLMETDDLHAQTMPFVDLLHIRGDLLVVPAHFPAEVVGVLSRTGVPEPLIDEAIDLFESNTLFDIVPMSVGDGMIAAEIARKARIRGSDAMFLALAYILELPLITWDKQQHQRGALLCRTMTPIEAVHTLR
jgi:predicted nucleic acid-binding protein